MQNNLTKSELKNKIENLEKYFSKYKNESFTKKLEEVTQRLDNQEYKIAVVANMSSGKSTFINALFGKEVLPAYNHATTDSATYIFSKPDIEKKAEIFFSKESRKESIEVFNDLEVEIKQYAQKDQDCKDDKYKNVEKINLYYPFEKLQTSSNEDFSITFIDTPGPNSTGGDYAQKHKDQTSFVIRDIADMVLFVFDYGQIDANLKSDEQNLWARIKNRYDKKEEANFEVYFLINKTDMAMKDNFQNIPAGINSDEFKKQKKENWFKHEEIAKNKIIEAAKKNGIDNPKVYPISSYYQLLERKEDKNEDEEDSLDGFKKRHFKKVFEKEEWEEKFIDYLGVSNLENDINQYINISVKEKILKIAFDNIGIIKNDELSSLIGRIQTLSKPKEEATENVNKALEFLDGEAKVLEKDMMNKFKNSEDKYVNEINNIISSAIEKELLSKIDEMSKMSIAYAEAIAGGDSIHAAKTFARSSFRKINLEEKIILELEGQVQIDNVLKEMQNYMKSIFEEYKNNYLDVKTDLKNSYIEYEREITKFFKQAKNNLNSQLENALNIDIQSIEMQTVDINSTLTFEVTIPDSVLDYKYQEAEYKTRSTSKWYNPLSWGSSETVTVQDEKHSLIINPLDLKDSIERSMNKTIDEFSGKEKENYIDAITSLRRKNSDIFQDFRINKQKEIDKLEEDIKNAEKELVIVEKQREEFNNLTKE